jgi:AraC-like DNA-binding protein
MNAKSEKLVKPFFETCWKGVIEIVVPLNHNGKHLGMLYAGSWRQEDAEPSSELRSKGIKEFYKLPLFDESKAENISMILDFFTKGMLAEIERWHIIDIPKYSRMGKIKLFIINNLDKQIQLSSLSEHLGISKSRTSFLLKRFFNQSFSQLVCEERIRRAKILLLGTDDSVSMIAEQVGINDEYYFNKVFKKIAGVPPGKFRKM